MTVSIAVYVSAPSIVYNVHASNVPLVTSILSHVADNLLVVFIVHHIVQSTARPLTSWFVLTLSHALRQRLHPCTQVLSRAILVVVH